MLNLEGFPRVKAHQLKTLLKFLEGKGSFFSLQVQYKHFSGVRQEAV